MFSINRFGIKIWFLSIFKNGSETSHILKQRSPLCSAFQSFKNPFEINPIQTGVGKVPGLNRVNLKHWSAELQR